MEEDERNLTQKEDLHGGRPPPQKGAGRGHDGDSGAVSPLTCPSQALPEPQGLGRKQAPRLPREERQDHSMASFTAKEAFIVTSHGHANQPLRTVGQTYPLCGPRSHTPPTNAFPVPFLLSSPAACSLSPSPNPSVTLTDGANAVFHAAFPALQNDPVCSAYNILATPGMQRGFAAAVFLCARFLKDVLDAPKPTAVGECHSRGRSSRRLPSGGPGPAVLTARAFENTRSPLDNRVLFPCCTSRATLSDAEWSAPRNLIFNYPET